MARSDTVGMVAGAVILTGWGVIIIVIGAMGQGGWAYATEGAGLIAGGGFAARSLRRATWADDAGLRLRGMFWTRVIPWSHVRYIRVRPTGRGRWSVEAGLADDTVTLPGTDGTPDRARRFAADLSAVITGERWLAIGLDLTPVPPAEGRHQTPLLVTVPLRSRANWGLPGMTGADQTGAPLLCSSADTLAPGESARVVIIPLTGAHMSEWRLLGQGDRLRLFEGPRVCGHAVVRWSENTSLPVPSTDTGRFSAWVRSSDDRPRPA